MEKNNTLHARSQKEMWTVGILFLLPAVIILCVYMVYPILDTFQTSLYNWNGVSADKRFIGLANWKELVADKVFWESFLHNCILMVLSIVIQLPIGIALALFLWYTGKKSSAFKVIWFFPMLMSSVAVAFLFQYILATNDGMITMFSQLLGGGKIDLLGNPKRALYAVLGVVCWQSIPFYMIFFLASYSTIPEELFDAARIDGASRNKYFWHIMLPNMKGAISQASVLAIVGSLKYFDLIFAMTKGGPGTATEVMATYMYRNTFITFRMGYGSAIAGGMFILITLFSLMTMRVTRVKEG